MLIRPLPVEHSLSASSGLALRTPLDFRQRLRFSIWRAIRKLCEPRSPFPQARASPLPVPQAGGGSCVRNMIRCDAESPDHRTSLRLEVVAGRARLASQEPGAFSHARRHRTGVGGKGCVTQFLEAILNRWSCIREGDCCPLPSNNCDASACRVCVRTAVDALPMHVGYRIGNCVLFLCCPCYLSDGLRLQDVDIRRRSRRRPVGNPHTGRHLPWPGAGLLHARIRFSAVAQCHLVRAGQRGRLVRAVSVPGNSSCGLFHSRAPVRHSIRFLQEARFKRRWTVRTETTKIAILQWAQLPTAVSTGA
jgi:hypothetical protein